LCAALTAKEHLEQGNAFLKVADFTNALEQYHQAIGFVVCGWDVKYCKLTGTRFVDKDPKSYEGFFKRATVYLATGRARQAVRDLSTVLEIKPGFDLVRLAPLRWLDRCVLMCIVWLQARVKRAELLLKEGSLDEARADYKLLPATPAHQEALHTIETVAALLQNGRVHQQGRNFRVALDAYTQAIEVGLCFWVLLFLLGEFLKPCLRGAIDSTQQRRSANAPRRMFYGAWSNRRSYRRRHVRLRVPFSPRPLSLFIYTLPM
jgi:tetratricopeptide (TPR) repeat protein